MVHLGADLNEIYSHGGAVNWDSRLVA